MENFLMNVYKNLWNKKKNILQKIFLMIQNKNFYKKIINFLTKFEMNIEKLRKKST